MSGSGERSDQEIEGQEFPLFGVLGKKPSKEIRVAADFYAHSSSSERKAIMKKIEKRIAKYEKDIEGFKKIVNNFPEGKCVRIVVNEVPMFFSRKNIAINDKLLKLAVKIKDYYAKQTKKKVREIKVDEDGNELVDEETGIPIREKKDSTAMGVMIKPMRDFIEKNSDIYDQFIPTDSTLRTEGYGLSLSTLGNVLRIYTKVKEYEGVNNFMGKIEFENVDKRGKETMEVTSFNGKSISEMTKKGAEAALDSVAKNVIEIDEGLSVLLEQPSPVKSVSTKMVGRGKDKKVKHEIGANDDPEYTILNHLEKIRTENSKEVIGDRENVFTNQELKTLQSILTYNATVGTFEYEDDGINYDGVSRTAKAKSKATLEKVNEDRKIIDENKKEIFGQKEYEEYEKMMKLLKQALNARIKKLEKDEKKLEKETKKTSPKKTLKRTLKK